MDEQIMRETLGEQEPESFEELIAGRYHGDFTRKVQQLMDRRFAEHRQKEEQWAQWLPAVEKLCADRGLDPADAEGLTALLEKEAGARERREALREWAACQTMRQWLEEAKTPEEVIERFRKEGFNVGNNKAFMYARALTKGRVIIVSENVTKEELEKMMLGWAPNLQAALDMVCAERKPRQVIVLPKAVSLIPKVVC